MIIEDGVQNTVEDEVIHRLLVEDVEQMLVELDEQEQVVLRMHFGFYGEKYSLSAMSEQLGLSIWSIRVIEKNAIKKIRQAGWFEQLEPYKDSLS